MSYLPKLLLSSTSVTLMDIVFLFAFFYKCCSHDSSKQIYSIKASADINPDASTRFEFLPFRRGDERGDERGDMRR